MSTEYLTRDFQRAFFLILSRSALYPPIFILLSAVFSFSFSLSLSLSLSFSALTLKSNHPVLCKREIYRPLRRFAESVSLSDQSLAVSTTQDTRSLGFVDFELLFVRVIYNFLSQTIRKSKKKHTQSNL